MVDYNKLMHLDYLEMKKHNNRHDIPLKKRAAEFLPFNALEGYQEELRKAEKRQRDKYRHEDKYYNHSN